MDGKATNSIELTIKQKKNNLTGQLTRAAIFARYKIFEIMTAEKAPFYAILYRNSLVYGDNLKEIPKGSFLDKAFQKGMVLEASDPLLQLAAPRKPLAIPNKNKLFTQLQHHHSSQETAYIITTLDSFFEKEQLIENIDKLYSHLKREGKHFKAYRILRILKDFAPESKAIQTQFRALEFHYFHDIYNSDLAAFQEKDPLAFEQYCFENRFNPDEQAFLQNQLEKENRQLDSLLLWIETTEKQPSSTAIRQRTDIALKHVSLTVWVQILSKTNINPFKKLPESKSLIETMVKESKHEQAASLLLPFINDLPNQFKPVLKSIWTNLDPQFIAGRLNDLIPALEQMAASDNETQFNQLLSNLAANLLKENELSTVQQKLAPLKQCFPHSATIRKIDHMAEISEDPESMMQLGQYYAEFKQYDPAIECFSMEMEFHPDEADPIWHLSKMYQHKGMIEEAEAYQKYFTELKKKS